MHPQIIVPANRLETAIVHDGNEEVEVKLRKKRLDQLRAFFQEHPNIMALDGPLQGDVIARDANEATSFVVPQLAYTEAKMHMRQYTPMRFREILPVSSEAGEWAQSIRYEKGDIVGKADFGSDMGDDMPFADVKYDESSRNIGHIPMGYRYSFQELRETAYLRRPLNERRLAAASESVERFLNYVAFNGSAKKNLTGLFNTADIPQDVATTGDWDDPSTAVSTILADLNFGLNAVYTNSNYNDFVTDVGIPPAAWTVLTARARTDYSDTTVIEFLKKNNICKATANIDLNIYPLPGLETAGAATKGGSVTGSNSRVVFFVRNQDRLVFHVPMALRYAAPQYVNLAVKVPGEARCGGLEVRYKQSMFYLDNVLTAG